MKPKWNGHIIPAGIKWSIPLRPEGNGSLHSDGNEMAHSIPAGMKWQIPIWPE